MAKLTISILTATLGFCTASLSTRAQAAVAEQPGMERETSPLRAETRRPGEQTDLDATGEPSRAPESLSLGGRAFMAPTVGVGALGVGLDEAYSVIPNLAVGGQYLRYVVDQGADPQYCERCIREGQAALLFGEGRLWPERWFTPYARAGVGLSFVNGQRLAYDSGYAETDFTLLAEAGVELHHRWFSARAYGFHLQIMGTELDRDPFSGFGTQLGARF